MSLAYFIFRLPVMAILPLRDICLRSMSGRYTFHFTVRLRRRYEHRAVRRGRTIAVGAVDPPVGRRKDERGDRRVRGDVVSQNLIHDVLRCHARGEEWVTITARCHEVILGDFVGCCSRQINGRRRAVAACVGQDGRSHAAAGWGGDIVCKAQSRDLWEATVNGRHP